MSVSITIKNKLKALIESCDSVQKVYGYEETDPKGHPSVMLTTTDMEGEFASTAEDSRVYTYQAMILFPTGQDFVDESEAPRYEYAEDVVATVIDEIIDAIDTDFSLTGVGQPIVRFVNATDVTWGYVTAAVGECRVATVVVSVYTEKTVR